MRIYKNNTPDLSGNINICVAMDDVVIEFTTDIFDKASIRKGFDVDTVFEHINGYWATLQRNQQLAIFNAYDEIRKDFDNIFLRAPLTASLTQHVTKLLDAHDFGHLKHWVEFSSDVIIPVNLESEYIDNRDRSRTREQTYLRSEYVELVTLSIILRTMIPVWGEYIYRNKKQVHNTYKEFYAAELITRSKLYQHRSIGRLLLYIEHNFPKDKSLTSHVLGGLSMQDVPMWMMALVLVRRLTMGDLKNPNPTHTLVSYIFKFIYHRLQASDGNFSGEIKEKEPDTQNDDGGVSVLENYKIKQEVPTAQLVILETAMRDINTIHHALDSEMDVGRIQEAMRTVSALHNTVVDDIQITLLQWIMKPVISPRGILHLNKTTLLNALALAQEYLWKNNFHFLACLLTAKRNQTTDELIMASSDARTRIPKEILETLAHYYPYDSKMRQKSITVKRTSNIVDVIDNLALAIGENVWTSTMSEEDTTKAMGRPTGKRIIVPADIKILLAELILHVARRQEVHYKTLSLQTSPI